MSQNSKSGLKPTTVDLHRSLGTEKGISIIESPLIIIMAKFMVLSSILKVLISFSIFLLV